MAGTDHNEFVKLVLHMRNVQRNYFKTRSSAALDASKAAEKKVDAAIRHHLGGPVLMFGDAEEAKEGTDDR